MMETLQKLHDFIVNANTATLSAGLEQKVALNQGEPVSIYFLTNFTINPIDPILQWYLYTSDVNPNIVFGSYDSARQEVLDPESPFHQQNFAVVVAALLYFPTDAVFLERLQDVNTFIAELRSLFDLIQSNCSSLILINTFILPFYSETGLVASTGALNHTDAILTINQFIRDYAKQNANRFLLLDWSRYLQILGETASLDYRYWSMYKAPFKKAFLSCYASDITKVVRALKGRAKKCLILDCDNTLWGGIIGEDGLAGIKLDNHDHPGKLFYDFQQQVLALSKRGVILALCSKNNEQDVWEVFEKHPFSLLQKNHFAAHRINWVDKVNNIIELVKELNIGFDSCVFVDDSATECELVKLALPMVTVIQVPATPFEYSTLLLKEGLFDTLTINEEDLQRNLQYQQEALRKAVFKSSENITDYLASLELTAIIHQATADELARVAQLTQKTNQFNLSTHRYASAQIENFSASPNAAVYSLSVKDRFGNYGLTGVCIVKKENQQGYIDSLLMSCRILSRNLEFVFLHHCLKQLSAEWGVTSWIAEYIKTDKNAQIEDFLRKAGFQWVEKNNYHLNIHEWAGQPIDYISLITEGYEHA